MFLKSNIIKSSVISFGLLISAGFLSAYAQVEENTIKEIKKISDSINLAKNEYSMSVKDGKVIQEEEYAESNLFLKDATKRVTELEKKITPENKNNYLKVKDNVLTLFKDVKAKVDPDIMSKQVLLSDQNLEAFVGISLKELPFKHSSIDNGKKLFAQNCASCHGIKGLGDGVASKGMNPPPINFHTSVVNEVSPYNFYRAIKNGIGGTAMPSWEYQLSLQEKWNVINYVRSLSKTEADKKIGIDLYNKYSQNTDIKNISNIDQNIDKPNLLIVENLKKNPELSNLKDNDLINLVEYVRNEKTDYSQVTKVEEKSKKEILEDKITEIKTLMYESKETYKTGDINKSIEQAINSYMEFEPIERELAAKNKDLARKIELDFTSLKGLYNSKADENTINNLLSQIELQMGKSVNVLTKNKTGWALFLQSMFLIMREGFETIIVIAALLGFIKKSSNDTKLLKNMYSGIGLGVLASFVTAYILDIFLKTAKLSKEFIEGTTVLLAAGILFYVSHWLVSKTQSQQWQKFIRNSLNSALSNKNQLALVMVGFLSVYREGFETILFYKALYTTTSSTDMITMGLVTGVVALAIISTLFYRFSVKIPLKEFFMVTGLLLYYMVFSFVGKGLREFQEANLISITNVPGIPEIDLMGIYPTLETLSAQLIVLLLWIGAVAYSLNSKEETDSSKQKSVSVK